MADQETTYADRRYCFGSFCLAPQRRLLLENGKPVRLGSRALEMLIVLLERHGELVSKQELTARVWPSTVVVEGNLTAQLTALRRALGDGHDGHRYILNDPGRGYRFVAPVTVDEEPATPVVPVASEAAVSSSLLRMAELCYTFMGGSPQPAMVPRNERVAVDAILQQGIKALELARTLVASDDFDLATIRSGIDGGNRMGGRDAGRRKSRWLEAGYRRGYPAAA